MDPETGLTWFQAKVREDALRERRENRIAEKTELGEYVLWTEVERMIEVAKQQLALLPVKVQSEFAIDDKMKSRMDALVDETFKNMGKVLMGRKVPAKHAK